MELILNSGGIEHICYYDQKDHELISGHKWRKQSKGYAVASIKGRDTYMHRLILGLTDSSTHVDHIDHDKLNNQRDNLRICNRSENQWNRKKGKGTSRYKGVRRINGKWRAEINKEGKKYHIGCFRSETTAGYSYDNQARRMFGRFANPNFKEVRDEPEQLTLL